MIALTVLTRSRPPPNEARVAKVCQKVRPVGELSCSPGSGDHDSGGRRVATAAAIIVRAAHEFPDFDSTIMKQCR